MPGSAAAADFPAGLPGAPTFSFVDGSDIATQMVSIKGDTDVEGNDASGFRSPVAALLA
ncbi:hypothetical protein [Sphingomonas sp. CFBP 8760]|uniref:hypothetical protein n=1 Tax=Sphingomonas sp. CFBP 8760 TaxID=2775282 RepID=UPI0017815826|nr:hypothetical protein [Sphingomonas sp. CFBP 8760]MBD8547942.1 hypothetical protein [Sphingomonas sp. CFBP 8760]